MSERVRRMRIRIPKVMLEDFVKEPMALLQIDPCGLWPIPPELLANHDRMNRMINDKEFQEKFELVIIPR